jgi:hypothetical protein
MWITINYDKSGLCGLLLSDRRVRIEHDITAEEVLGARVAARRVWLPTRKQSRLHGLNIKGSLGLGWAKMDEHVFFELGTFEILGGN